MFLVKGVRSTQQIQVIFGTMCVSLIWQADQVTKWRVENSWGEDRNEKGYLLMTTPW
jgi:aminopeptidase C